MNAPANGPDLAPALAFARAAALEAAEIVRAETSRFGGPRPPRGRCPADEEAEHLIRRRLQLSFPDWGYLGEETGHHSGDGTHVWVVDPNDGTEPMQDGFRGHAISIALLRDRVPVLGVVLAVTAPDDDGDLFEWALECGPLRRNGKAVPSPEWPSTLGPHHIVAVSQAADRSPAGNVKSVDPARYLPVTGIAYRLALVAAGEAVAAVSLNNPGAVDYAGGHALLLGQGAILVDETGQAITYSASGHSHCARCFGGAPQILPTLVGRSWSGVRHGGYGGSAPDPECEPARLAPGHHLHSSGVLARAQGCLLGQLAGDSLGSLVEFQSARSIASRYPNGGPRELADGGTWSTIAGQPTDDSEMALALARTLIHSGADADAIAAAYARWSRSHPFDIGSTTSTALVAVHERGRGARSPSEQASAAANQDSQANGGLMRISPLAIWGWETDPMDLADLARADARLTHPHQNCREVSAVYVVAIAAALRGGLDALATYSFACDWASAHCLSDAVIDRLRHARTSPPAADEPAGWVLVAFQHAFHALLSADSVHDGVISVVRHGGDTDTNAAICGALLGAVHGREGIPATWRRAVLTCRPLSGAHGVHHPRAATYWPSDALVLAERLLLAGSTAGT